MVLDKAFLGPTPESLQAVDVDLAGREMFSVVYLQVSVAAKHEAVIAAELIRVNDTAPADLLDGKREQRGRRDIRNDRHMNPTVPLQDAEHRDFAGGAPSPVAFTSAAEVGLVQFDLPIEQGLGILGMAQNGQPDDRHGPVNGPIRHVQLQGHLADRDFQFKELDEGQPLHGVQSAPVNPPSRKIMEGILTA